MRFAKQALIVVVVVVAAAAYGEFYCAGLQRRGLILWIQTRVGGALYAAIGGDPVTAPTAWQTNVVRAATWFAPVALLSVGLYIIANRFLGRRRSADDRETRCRKCHYILRGLEEARCPECGERI